MPIQDRNAETREELRSAAREIREQVLQEIQQARGGTNQSAPTAPIPPVPGFPTNPRIVVTPMPERHQVVVGESRVPPFASNEIPPQAVDMALGFFFTVAVIIIGLPISRAFARRMDRKAVPAPIPVEISSQLGQLTQAVDAIALEVERISEGQRFATRLLSEQREGTRPALTATPDR